MGSSNLHTFLYVEESAWGTTPAAAGTIVNVNTPAVQLSRNVGTPEVIRGDFRDYADTALQESGTASFTCPHQFGNTLWGLEGVLCNDVAADYAITGTGISFTSPDTIDDTGSGLAGLTVGKHFRVTGAGAGTNAGKWFGPVLTSSAGSVTVPSGIANQAAGSTVNINGIWLPDATTEKSYSIERDLTSSAAGKYHSGTGFEFTSFALTVQNGSFATESWQMIGKKPTFAGATIFTGGPTAAPVTPFTNSLQNIANIKIDNAATSLEISQLTLTVTTTRSARYVIASSTGPVGITTFRVAATIELRGYFDAAAETQLEGMDAHTTFGLSFELNDGTNQEIWTIPSIKPNTGEATTQRDNDAMFTLGGKSFENATYGYTIAHASHTA